MSGTIVTRRCLRACRHQLLCRACTGPFNPTPALAAAAPAGRCHCHTGGRLAAVRRRSQSCRPGSMHPPPPSSVTLGIIDLENNRRFSAARQGSSESQARSTVREWVQYLSRISPSIDVSAVTRALNSLNIDMPKNIPKNIPQLRNMLPSISLSQIQQPIHDKRTKSEKSLDRSPAADQFTSSGHETSASCETTTMAGSTLQSSVKLLEPDVPTSSREPHESAITVTKDYDAVKTFPTLTGGQHSESAAPTSGGNFAKLMSAKKMRQELNASKLETSSSFSAYNYIPDSVISTFNSVTSGISQQFAGLTGGTKSADMSTTAVLTPEDARKAVLQRTGVGSDGDANKPAVTSESKSAVKRQLVARGSIEKQTRGLVLCLRDAKSPTSQLVRLEELCRHILLYPDCTGVAVKGKVVPCLLRLRESHDAGVAERAREALSLVGYVNPVQGRGIRALCLDGGGTKGLMSIRIMKRLEELSGRPIYELFDYVCGVSTGSLIGIMGIVFRVPVMEMEEIYKEFSVQMFERNRLLGAGKLFMSHAYYDTELWARLLQENIGLKSLSETARDAKCPKYSAVSTLVNVPRVQNFLFRNYNLPMSRQSHYVGSVNHFVWEAIRASSAAPGYYEECTLGDYVHQDGGLLTNNPTAIAIHECRLLWPSTPLQCVVSIGTGKFEPTSDPTAAATGGGKSSSLKHKVAKIVESATDTEAVHTVLHDLLPASTYFRFNPYLSEEFMLDEIRSEKWDQMHNDTEMYCRKNAQQLEKAAERLLQPKPAYASAVDRLRLEMDKRL